MTKETIIRIETVDGSTHVFALQNSGETPHNYSSRDQARKTAESAEYRSRD